MPENDEAWRLYQEVKTQWRAGGSGFIGLDYPEVRRGAREIGLSWTIGLKRKIQALEWEVLSG
jgi:hypothetical protein